MKRTISMTVNKKKLTLDIDIRASLMDVLREQGFGGIKHGCGVGECGACTVLVDEIAVDSCIYLALWANGKAVRTVEGECKEGKLSPVQQAYVEAGAVQCGFCTPGLIMTTTSFLERNKGKKLSRHEIRTGHAGNLCRCTGYETIVRAVELATATQDEEEKST